MRLFLLFFLFCTQLQLWSQEPSDVLITINDEAITVDEYTRVYEKNLGLVKDANERNPKAYLDLFIAYKLKVQEAYTLELEKKPSYQKELRNYRKQLIKTYLTDVNVTDALIQEAYDRTKEERRARHILIRLSPTATPSDTIAAFNKINAARERILEGEEFSKVATEVSEDPSALKNGGDLGFFKAFKMVYPFESAAYKTPLGEVSEPFKTRFGYHIVQPTERRLSKGTVTVAHIMVSLKQKDSTINPKERIQEVYDKLTSGTSFEMLAQNYSDDKNSAIKGGALKPIAEGQLSTPVFEKKAFALVEIGSYTEPFETKFGWHIVKLLAKTPTASFNEMQLSLRQKVERDTRARVIDESLNEKLRKRYGIAETKEIEDYFKKVLPEDYRNTAVELDTVFMTEAALKIGDSSITYGDYSKYLKSRMNRVQSPSKNIFVEEQVKAFTNKAIRSYHEDNLEFLDADFNAVLREYKEGLLLFDFLDSQIWQKAKTDTVGLEQYFAKNRDLFKSDPLVDVIVTTSPTVVLSKKAKKILKKDFTFKEVENALLKKSKEFVSVKKTIRSEDLPDGVIATKNSISVINNEQGVVIYKIIDVIPSEIRSLDEVRGVVVSAYQKDIEDTLVASLKKNASIIVNEPILNALQERYNE